VPEHDVPVLIVGGSLVGLSTALLLGHHGIRSFVVEHHRGTAIHPRAAQVHQRTMEIYREVGIEQIVRTRSDEQFVQDGAVMAVETLAGKELAYFIANLNEGIRDVSPSERVFISQTLLEPLLKTRAEELGATLRFATEMTSFSQHADGVTATLTHRDTGVTDTVRAGYMVACDGAHSRVRQALGIPMEGRGTFAKSATIYFRAEVGPILRGRNLSVIYVNNTVQRSFIRVEKPFTSGFLAITGLGDPDHPVTDVSAGLDDAKAIELVRNALGVDDLPVTIDDIMRWNAEADSAATYRQGRVFLAGDSAHVMPPHGGFGGNTGVADAHNLAWKIALTLSGDAGPALLDSYDTERRPVGQFTAEQAYSRYVTRTAPYLASQGMQPVVGDLDVELGYGYNSDVILPDGEPAPLHQNPRESRGLPGTRAPHVWIEKGGVAPGHDDTHTRMSTLDLFGRHFVLLVGRDGEPWQDAARQLPADTASRVDVHRVGRDIATADGDLGDALGIGTAGASLVRPDGVVAWRSSTSGNQPDCPRVLQRALAVAIGRERA
jgi:2-polyprenyl-6-methoxyphenol hydroxylase-like FAD-dependent oxidoreductase